MSLEPRERNSWQGIVPVHQIFVLEVSQVPVVVAVEYRRHLIWPVEFLCR